MNYCRLRNYLLAIVLSLGILPCLAVPAAGTTDLGLQVSTDFEAVMAGLKIQLGDIAITPKFGFAVQHFKNRGTGFMVGMGAGFDYYLQAWTDQKIRPYLGNDLVLYVSDMTLGTHVWVADDVHVGVEYWISDRLSFGGNIGAQLGFGNAAYTSGALNTKVGTSSVSFGVTSKINMTYYF